MGKIGVSILGATGMVGQKFVELLSDHPMFEIVSLAASAKSVGKSYKEAVEWRMGVPLPDFIASMKVESCKSGIKGKIVFSGLCSSVAGDIEEEFANNGYIVISNAKNHRMHPSVPLLIPEINSEHLKLIDQQTYNNGKIITNPNCSVVGISMALKPLVDQFGVSSVNVVTLQALSGAGHPGVASIDILDNVIPFIHGEEEKIETEPLKILGTYKANQITPYPISISAQCTRVPVSDGHLACISVSLEKKATREEIIAAWKSFSGEPQQLNLPLAPKHPIIYLEGEKYPQPKLHRNLEKGMAVSIGRLRKCSNMQWKFVILSHNTIRGAAGSAILNAEYYVRLNP